MEFCLRKMIVTVICLGKSLHLPLVQSVTVIVAVSQAA